MSGELDGKQSEMDQRMAGQDGAKSGRIVVRGKLEELRIESSFPLDDATRRFCEEQAP